MFLRFFILLSFCLNYAHSYFPWYCGCNYAIGCFDDSNCCAGLVCVSNNGFSQCQENPLYMQPSKTIPACLHTNTDWGCRRNTDCCNPAAICGSRRICIFNQTCTMSYRSALPSGLPTSQPSATPTVSPSNPSSQPTLQPFRHPTRRPSHQPIALPSKQPNQKPSQQPTSRPSTPSSQPSEQPATLPTQQPSSNPSQPSSQPSQQPTLIPSQQPASKPSRNPTEQPTRKPSRQPVHSPSINPTSQPSGSPTEQPFSFPTTQPNCFPTDKPTVTPSLEPSSQPQHLPSASPSKQPRQKPTSQPNIQPSSQPSKTPKQKPSQQPTRLPTTQPSRRPYVKPSAQPNRLPSLQPTQKPTIVPSSQPSRQPNHNPSSKPSNNPTKKPFCAPSKQPSNNPTQQPLDVPTSQPSQPSQQPTISPSSRPSRLPSRQPNRDPSRQPIRKPSRQPSRQPVVLHPTGQPRKHPSHDPTRQPIHYPSWQPLAFPSSNPSLIPIKLVQVAPLAWYKQPLFAIGTGVAFGSICFFAAFYGFAVFYFKHRVDKKGEKDKVEKVSENEEEKEKEKEKFKSVLSSGQTAGGLEPAAPTPESTDNNCQCVSDLYPQDKLDFSTDQIEWVSSSEQLMEHYTSKKFAISASKHDGSDDENSLDGAITFDVSKPSEKVEHAADTVQPVIARRVAAYCEPENSDSEASIIDGGEEANCSFSQLYEQYKEEGKAVKDTPPVMDSPPVMDPPPVMDSPIEEPKPTTKSIFSQSASVDMTQIYSNSVGGVSKDFSPSFRTDTLNSQSGKVFSFSAVDMAIDGQKAEVDFTNPYRILKNLLSADSVQNMQSNSIVSDSKRTSSPNRSPKSNNILDSKQEPASSSPQVSPKSTLSSPQKEFAEHKSNRIVLQESTTTVSPPTQQQRPTSAAVQKAERVAKLLEIEAKNAELNMFDIYPEENEMNSKYEHLSPLSPTDKYSSALHNLSPHMYDGNAESLPSPKRNLFQNAMPAKPSSAGNKKMQSKYFTTSPPQLSPTSPRKQQHKSPPIQTQPKFSPDSFIERVPSVDKPLVNSKAKSPQRATASFFARSIVSRMTTPGKQQPQASLDTVTIATKPASAAPNTPPSIALEPSVLTPPTATERTDLPKHSDRFKETRMLFENFQQSNSLSSSQNGHTQILSGVKVQERKQKFESLIEKNIGTPIDMKKGLRHDENDVPSTDLNRPRNFPEPLVFEHISNRHQRVEAAKVVPPLQSRHSSHEAVLPIKPINRSRSFSSRSQSPSSIKSKSHLYFEDVSDALKGADDDRGAAQAVEPPDVSPYEAYRRLKLTLPDYNSSTPATKLGNQNPKDALLSTPLLEIKSLSALQSRAKATGDFRIQSMMTNHTPKENDKSPPNAKEASPVLNLSEVNPKQRVIKLGPSGESVNDMYEKILQTYFSPTIRPDNTD